MKDIVLITGANGHLAKVVTKNLRKDYEVRNLTTNKKMSNKKLFFHWDVKKGYLDCKALENCKHIIHLAGFSIIKRWTKKNKQIMYDSRIESTRLIYKECKKNNVHPKTFISASAMGIYDQSLEGMVHEKSQKGKDWLASMACDWENASNKFKKLDSRVIQMRISLIFSKNSGFLKYNLLAMKFGIGAIIGNPNSKINWIHVKDVSRFIQECIEKNKYNGAYNLACDDKISQKKFLETIRDYIFPYALIIKIPMFFIKLILGERSKIINNNLCLETTKMKNYGFRCKINSLEKTLTNPKINL